MSVSSKSPIQNSRDSVASRKNLVRRTARLGLRVKDLKSKLAVAQQRIQELEKKCNSQSKELEIANAMCCVRSLIEQPALKTPLENERPLPGHHFCVTLIALAIRLGQRVGCRGAADILATVFDVLHIDLKAPSHDAIAQWIRRVGVGCLKQTFTPDDKVLWMADHSSQISQEKVLLIIGIALQDLPPPGETLCLEHMKVLAVVPGVSWTKADVASEYQKLAKAIGAPAYLLCDGASELRDPAKELEKNGEKTIVLGDLKHHAANVLEKEVGRDERFQEFVAQVGLTRSRIQQTELSHFTPPPGKQKSRFMNLGPLLNWAAMVLHHLDHPESKAQEGICSTRMNEKLGWLRDFRSDVLEWNQCQTVIDQALYVINHQGLSSETADLVKASFLETGIDLKNVDRSSCRIAEKLLVWVETSASLLRKGERAWASTEILESLFGRFKQLEGQHSKGGFTRLIAAIPTLCAQVNGELVRKTFGLVKAQDVLDWLTERLGTTRNALRNAAYKEYRKGISATLNPAA